MSLCGHDDAQWADGSATTRPAPQARAQLRDGIVRAVETLPRPS